MSKFADNNQFTRDGGFIGSNFPDTLSLLGIHGLGSKGKLIDYCLNCYITSHTKSISI